METFVVALVILGIIGFVVWRIKQHKDDDGGTGSGGPRPYDPDSPTRPR